MAFRREVITPRVKGAYLVQLIGMLDSPYVRREATVFHILELPFEHLGVVSENGK